MRYGIVTTTIYSGDFIDLYYEHFKKFGNPEDVNFYVIGDLDTDPGCRENVEKYSKMGLAWKYFGPQEQDLFLSDFPELLKEIPWGSDNRRNVGFLMAYRDKCDVIISIDDDNYPRQDWPFLKGHSALGQNVTLPVAIGSEGWFNICSLMKIESSFLGKIETVYPRGFPYRARNLACSKISSDVITKYIAVSVGLWSGHPDVDACTRLVTNCNASENLSSDYLLAPNVMMPINTQNTAIIRDALPAYYYVKMGHSIGGMKLDRFGDIFSGYFLQKCIQSVGHSVKIGSPVVEHRRFPHNLYKDLWNELAGMVIIDDMLPLLEEPLTAEKNYSDATVKMSERLEDWASKQEGFFWDESLKGYFRNISSNMRLWVETCHQLE
jgi:hypothetical protein